VEVELKKLRILGVIVGITMMIVAGLLLPASSQTASAHVVAAPPARMAQVRGDYLSVYSNRGGCTYTIHFTLTRQMAFHRHFQVMGPNHPVLLWVRGNQAVATYQNYNRSGRAYQRYNRCFPDHQHQAWQFVLSGY